MKKKFRIIIAVVLAILLVSLSSAVVYGAYYGRGIFKDVFVNRKYIFASDYLVETTSINKATENKVHTVNDIVNIHVYNYDVSSGDYDNFDITFDVYAWVSSSGRSIKVELDGETINVSSTEATLIKSNLSLTKDIQDSKIISIKFEATGVDDLSTIPSINIAVKATSPSFLETKVLAANFTITKNDEFSIESYFDYTDSDNTYDYVAFKYYIVVNGEPAESSVTLTYDSAKLSVSAWSINSDVTKTSDGLLTISISKDEIIEIVFMRTTDTFWDSELTMTDGWTTIKNLVTLN